MSTPTGDLFTIAYWKVVLTQLIHAAAGSAVGVLSTAGVGHAEGVSVPWWGVLTAAGFGGLMSLLLSLAGSVTPGTAGPTFLPAGKPRATKKPAAERVNKRPVKATTTDQLVAPPAVTHPVPQKHPRAVAKPEKKPPARPHPQQ